MEKVDKYFVDWENYVFGYGYGTGEEYTLKALKDFMGCMVVKKNYIGYNHNDMYENLGTVCAWLMINILNHAGILEYGSSPRFGWLTERGRKLYDYLKTKTISELYKLTTSRKENEYYCYPDYCNCEELVLGKCNNPFF